MNNETSAVETADQKEVATNEATTNESVTQTEAAPSVPPQETAPSEAATVEAKPDETPAEESSAEVSSPDTSTTDADAKEAAATPAEAEDTSEEKASERIRIGTQREGDAEKEQLKPKPVHSVTEGDVVPQESKNYPPPSVRDQLSPEQEQELESIMAGTSVEDVMESSAAAAPQELAPETKLTGKVARVHGDSVFVDLGSHLQGVVPLKQFEPKTSPTAPAPAAPAEGEAAEVAQSDEKADPASHAPEVGTDLEVVVARYNTDEGIYDLTLPTAAVDVGNWDEVEAGQTVEVTITGKNKGGLECTVSGIRGFMPMGQISVYRVENPEEYVGQRLTAVITEANRSKKNLILSHRAVMERERSAKKDQLLAELAPGQIRDGVVRSLRDFGAFVDLGGVDGMIHVSKLSWDRVSHPKDVLSEGQAVKVKVEKVDSKTGKIALSYREMVENPWDKADQKYAIGSVVKGKVSKIMDFGGFVKLEPGVEGLIHISELDHKRIHRTSDVLSEGQEVEAKVLSVDMGKQRIALSMKALMAAPVKEEKLADEDMPLPADAPKAPRKKGNKNLKGGIGGPSGGEQFGLKW